MSVSHSERSDDAGGQYANKTNDEYGGIRASAVKLAKVLLLLVLSIILLGGNSYGNDMQTPRPNIAKLVF